MTMTSRERILAAMSHREPDRVPLILNPTMHPARDLGIPFKEYFTSPELVAQGLITSRRKFETDAYLGFHYLAVEYEAFGGSVVFRDDGPPNSGRPIITTRDNIDSLSAPVVDETPCLLMVLEMIRILRKNSPDNAPILGMAVSPLSLPVMQMGFEEYIRLMYTDKERFWNLISINSEFCVEWANAQLRAGATGIVYYDPVSSPLIIPRELYQKTGLVIARDVISKVQGPVLLAFASARMMPILDDILGAGPPGIGIWAGDDEDLHQIKMRCAGKMTVIGNLSGIRMRTWSREETFSHVRDAIRNGAPGGGFILSDTHGEIPLQVPDDVLYAVRDAVREYGYYPISL